MKKNKAVQERKKGKGFIKGIGSVLLAVIASSHHWVHTLLLALGLTTFSSSLLSLSPPTKIIFLLVSLVVSAWFIHIAKRKWSYDRPCSIDSVYSKLHNINNGNSKYLDVNCY